MIFTFVDDINSQQCRVSYASGDQWAPGGLLGVAAVSAITVPRAAPAPTIAPTFRTIVRTLRCFPGAMATPAGCAAVMPLTLGASAAAVPTGRCSSCLCAGAADWGGEVFCD